MNILNLFLNSVNAQDGLNTIEESASTIATIIEIGIVIVVAIAFIYFFYKLGSYILNPSSDNKDSIIYAVVALVVMVSIWGIVQFVTGALGIDSEAGAQNIEVPRVQIRT